MPVGDRQSNELQVIPWLIFIRRRSWVADAG